MKEVYFMKIFRISSIKKNVVLTVILTSLFIISSCSKYATASTDSRVLIVKFCDEDEKTDLKQIKEGLIKGGYIEINSDSIMSIDPEFDSKYANTNSANKYYIKPALLNFVSGQGWRFQQKFCINLNENNAEYYFIK